ncbi:MAG TPA: hypothetical protein VKY74_02750 [Chloroflexia bacterium]|nr:hypothetical protein [Chloroflexia bacterium]
MATHTIQVSDDAYRRLQAEASRLQLTPEQVVERLLRDAGTEPIADPEAPEAPIPPAGSAAALAAVQRLTTLFGDVAIPDLERVLADPLLALANVDLVDHES